MKERIKREAIPLMVLILLPLLWFWPVVFGGKTLIPFDNLYTFEPWRHFAKQMGVTVPHNALLSDLLLENYAWKHFIIESIHAHRIPLWNPYLFTGVPFLAAGQHSAMYPFSAIFYAFPLWLAYGIFTWTQIALAGIAMYVYLRVLHLRRVTSLFGAVTYAFSGFFIVSVVFSMIIAAAAWLPLILAVIEAMVQKQARKGDSPFSPVLYVVFASLLLGVQILAGHVEITYYVLLVSAFYAVWRLAWLKIMIRSWRRVISLASWMLVSLAFGLALGGIQLIPLYELVQHNFREGSVTYKDVVGWAWPIRQAITFVIPDFFGNPSHHAYFDIWKRAWVPVTRNALGQHIDTVFWGVKNYVEGGNTVGILPLLLSILATLWVFSTLARSRRRREASRIEVNVALFFVMLAFLSLAFAFGTPLYAVLYYGLPGYKQLHSAFRWVFPLTLSLAALASIGLEVLSRKAARWLGVAAILVALATFGAVAASVFYPAPFVALGEKVLRASDLARRAFSDGRMFWSYEAVNLAKFALVTALSGIALLLIRPAGKGRGRSLAEILAVAVVVFDLWLFGHGFNPAVDPRLGRFTPPVVKFLEQDKGLWRFTTLESARTTKTFNANVGMFYHFQDVRGYDSIIPRQYVNYMRAIEPQGQLLYNRISPFYNPASLQKPLTDLLGVKYVLTELQIDLPGWQKVYDGEIRVYRSSHVLPRAFGMVCRGTSDAPNGFSIAALDPRSQVLLQLKSGENLLTGCRMVEANVESYNPNSSVVSVRMPDKGVLLFNDAYFPGWKAYELREGEDDKEIPLYLADGNFRGVMLDAGEHRIRFKYTPMSAKLGLFSSFLAGMGLLLLFGWWVWGRVYRESGDEDHVKVVAKNSLIPMVLSLVNKTIDFAFAMLRLRVLEPAGEGSYTFAIAFYTFFEILVRFGLGTLLTRDVAQDKEKGNRYLSNVILLRLILWLVSLPVMGILLLGYAKWGNLSKPEAEAIVIFALALLFSSISDAFSALFNAHEKMEYPAGIASAIAWAKVALGAVVLLVGWGFVGLAGVSLVMNMVQVAWLYLLLKGTLFPPHLEVDRKLQKYMLDTSFPLMLNHLLATIFFRIDVWLLKPISGEVAVGLYSAAYKYIDGLNVIPAYFTIALFPLMSRLAKKGSDSLLRSYILALRILLMTAIPIAVATTFIARPLIVILGGAEFLPGSVWALQILIWSIPFGFVNSVTQYVLIAVDQQRFLTRAFVIGVVFNVVANAIFIPKYSYLASATITILSEIVLLIPFYYGVHKYIGSVPWGEVVWRPAVSGAAMALVFFGFRNVSLALGLIVGTAAYLVALWLVGGFSTPDMAQLLDSLPVSGKLGGVLAKITG